MKRNLLLMLALLILGIGTASAQKTITVTGTVVAEKDGQPIAGAYVLVNGTTIGTITDAEGKFGIKSVPADAKEIIVTFLGMTTASAPVSVNPLHIVMQEDSHFLEETIVVAYGTATKSSFTGSAAMVKAETIENRVTTNVTNALSGTTPGVQVIGSSGDPASGGASIRIRGFGSMSASNAPLYIVDGMPYDGSISDINPSDVESMSVLKDAAASAIYGARGANGVVLITTKRAQSSDAVVKFDAKWGSNSRLIPQYDVINDPALYYETHYKMLYNSQVYAGKTPAEAYAFADANLFDEKNGGLGYKVYSVPEGQKFIGTNFKLNPNATLGYSDGTYTYIPDNWYDETFHNSFRQEYNLSVSGRKDKFSYYASAGYLDDGGIVSNSDYHRFTARVNADYQAKKWFKVTTNVSYSHSDSKAASYDSGYGSSGNVFYITNNIAPIYPLYVRDAEGNIMYENGYKVYDANQTNFKRPNIMGNAVRDNEINSKKSYADVLNGKVGVVISPIEGLDITANAGLMNDNTRYNYLYSAFASGSSVDGQASVGHQRMFALNTQYLVSYKTDFKGSKHNFDVLAGYELYSLKIQSLSGSNDHLFDPTVGELGNADGTSQKNVSSYTADYITQGFLARAQYDYDGKYFISASYRRDASSRFAKGHRWGNFGSVGAAWLISQEGFMSGADWVNMLKLKASWGVQGNDSLYPNSSSAIKYYPYADNYTHSYNEETGDYSLTLSYKGNQDLTWESSHAFNVGVDFELFNGYLNGTVEYFSRTTVDLLYSKDVPLSSGNPTGMYPVNVGSIRNNGVEVTLGGNIINTKNIQWDWNFNISHYTNKILALDESVAENGIRGSYFIYKIGGSLYESYIHKFAGIDPETGKGLYYQKVLDKEGNWTGETKTTDVFADSDQFENGSILPKVYGGFGTTLRVYGVDLSVQLAYQAGGKYYDGTYQSLMHTSNGVGTAWHKDALKAWTPENPNTNVPRLDGDTSVGQTAVDCYFISSNYLSVNNVTLGYTFPKKWMDKIKVAGLRVYVAGDNLAVTSARKGVDPRFSVGLGSMTSNSGLNSGGYAAMRTITGGLTLTF
ncbi:MAG: TonB-dependent receptor [Bacteroidales bacterium]|nr:TonB-dependent receptor [Bacteroidales bacterium]